MEQKQPESVSIHPLRWRDYVASTPLYKARSTPVAWRLVVSVLALDANGNHKPIKWRRNNNEYRLLPGQLIITHKHLARQIWCGIEAGGMPRSLSSIKKILGKLRKAGLLTIERLPGHHDGHLLTLTVPEGAEIVDLQKPKENDRDPIPETLPRDPTDTSEPVSNRADETQDALDREVEPRGPTESPCEPLEPEGLQDSSRWGPDPTYLSKYAFKGRGDIQESYVEGDVLGVFEKVFEKAYNIQPDIDPVAEVWITIEAAAIDAGFDPSALALWAYGWMRGRRREEATPYCMLGDLQDLQTERGKDER
jgi:hypothetical protein